MLFTASEQDQMTFRQWETLVIKMERSLQAMMASDQGGTPMADEIQSVYEELTSEVIPTWL